MKKIVILLAMLSIIPSAFAYITTEDTSNPEFLQDKGYSESLIKLIDSEKYRSQGTDGTYERYYKINDVYTKKPTNFKEYAKDWYTRAKLYVDPIQDDDMFGEHDINFTNTWFPDNNKLKHNAQVEHL